MDQFIHRILVEEDISKPEESNQEIFDAAGEAGKRLYSKGGFARSRLMDLDAYLLRKVHILNLLILFSALVCQDMIISFVISGWTVSGFFRTQSYSSY